MNLTERNGLNYYNFKDKPMPEEKVKYLYIEIITQISYIRLPRILNNLCVKISSI